MYCEKCGANNADGNKFCEKCGAPLTTRDVGQSGLGFSSSNGNITINTGSFPELLKTGYRSPLEAMEMGKESSMRTEGLIIIGVKDLLMTILAAAGAGGQLMGGNAVKTFFLSLILFLLLDAIWLFISFGIGKAFGGKATLGEWIGAVGGSMVLSGTVTLVAALLSALGTGMAILALIFIVFSMLIGSVVNVELFHKVHELEGNRFLYAYIVAGVLFALAAFILYIIIIGTIVGSAAAGQLSNLQNLPMDPGDMGLGY